MNFNTTDIIQGLQQASDNYEYSNLSSNETVIPNLLAYHTYFKFAHWCASSMNLHKTIDDFYNLLSDYIDELAEVLQGISGQFKMSDLYIEDLDQNKVEVLDVINQMKQLLQNFVHDFQDNEQYMGAIDITTTFLKEIAKYTYLFRMCDTKLNK